MDQIDEEIIIYRVAVKMSRCESRCEVEKEWRLIVAPVMDDLDCKTLSLLIRLKDLRMKTLEARPRAWR